MGRSDARSLAEGRTRNMRGWDAQPGRDAKEADRARAVRLEGERSMVAKREALRLRSSCMRWEVFRLMDTPVEWVREAERCCGKEQRPCS